MSEPLLPTVQVRLTSERGELLKVVEIPRQGTWPRALDYRGQVFVWSHGDEYVRVVPRKVD